MEYKEHKDEITNRCDLLIAHCKSLLSFMYNPVEGLEEIVSNVDHTQELAEKLAEVSKGLNGAFTHDTAVAMGIKTILTEIEYDVTKIGLAYGNIIAHTDKEANNVVRRNEAMTLGANTVMNNVLLDSIKSNNVLLAYANDKLETSYKQLNPELEGSTNPKHTLYYLSEVCSKLSSDIVANIDSLVEKLSNKAKLLDMINLEDKSLLNYSPYDDLKDTDIVKNFKEQCIKPIDIYKYVINIVNSIPTKEGEYDSYINIVEYISNNYKTISQTVTDNINKFRANCDKIEELIKAFIETNQKVLDLSVTMSNNQITNEEYMKNIEEHIFRINVFTNVTLDTLNIVLNNGYVLDYISKSVNNLYLTTVNTFNMVK